MADDFFHGAACLRRGFSLMLQPGLRRYVFIPLTINLVVFAALIWVGAEYFDQLVHSLVPELPGWLAWLQWLMWVLFGGAALLVVFYGFTLVANLIGAPFNSLLAERVDQRLTGRIPPTASLGRALASLPATFIEELIKLVWFVVITVIAGVIALILLFVPVVNVAVAPAWFLFSAWLLALEYSDFPLGARGFNFRSQRKLLGARTGPALGFGVATAVATMIPVLNFFVMPAAVAGATALWAGHAPARD
ncbi:MAG: sulfate transporter CysZ [Gammaproteobacteria bacterium]|jgi:CysZ protein